MRKKHIAAFVSIFIVMGLAAAGYAASATDSGKSKSPLEAVIEAAKKEGTVTATLKAELKGEGVQRIEEGIKRKYGVDLNIQMQPTGGYPTDLAKAVTEHQAGLTPSYDLMTFSTPLMPPVIESGIGEKVDWKPLLEKGTPAEAIQSEGYGLTEYTGYIGLMYNPKTVREVPQKFSDLTDPKYKGRLFLYSYVENWANYAFVRGIDKTLADLRNIMKNSPLVGRYADGLTRYTTGEIDLAVTSSTYFLIAKDKGVPVEWQSLDVSWPTYHQMVLRKRAVHPNAAKLLAVFIASPEAVEIMRKSGQAGSLLYRGSEEYAIKKKDEERGLKVYLPDKWPGAMEFLRSSRATQLQKEIQQILSR